MGKAIVNGVIINYETAGAGTPLVLIHGHPFDHTVWYQQVAAFSDQYYVINPDLRGFGESSLPDGVTCFEDYATDMLCLLDHLKVDSFHVCGLSMGGQIIIEMYRQAPERIKSLIFADTFAGLDSPVVKQGRYNTATRLEAEGMGPYSDEVIYKMIMPEHVVSQPEVAAHLLKMMKSAPPAGAAAALRARAKRIDYLTLVLPEINVPALAIVGRHDEFTPVEKAEEIAHNIQNCKLAVIEDAGHLPCLEQPEAFNSTIINFLNAV
jgi:pimeloyl-ACP methyl ester carboxylesterase